jgi:hypothetical protein
MGLRTCWFELRFFGEGEVKVGGWANDKAIRERSNKTAEMSCILKTLL